MGLEDITEVFPSSVCTQSHTLRAFLPDDGPVHARPGWLAGVAVKLVC